MIKLDIGKAYDRMNWNFVEDTLCNVGLSVKLIRVIMNLTSSASSRLVRNGEVTDLFKQSRGL